MFHFSVRGDSQGATRKVDHEGARCFACDASVVESSVTSLRVSPTPSPETDLKVFSHHQAPEATQWSRAAHTHTGIWSCRIVLRASAN